MNTIYDLAFDSFFRNLLNGVGDGKLYYTRLSTRKIEEQE